MIIHRFGLGCVVLSLWTIGCSGDEDSAAGNGGKGGSSGASGSSGSSGAGGSTSGGTTSGGTTSGGSGTGGLPTVPGDPDPSVDTDLPPVPRMVNVKATATGDSVRITFDPIDGAVDYRVYVLPSDDDISVSSNGLVTVQDALYRCSGNRMATAVTMDGDEPEQGGAITTLVDGQDVLGYRRSLEEATLGYVYAEPGEGRSPVYVLGENGSRAENDCFSMRWNETRVKHYVTSEARRDELIARGFRDDGIGFYVPSEASGETRQVYTASDGEKESDERTADFYFVDGPEADAREDAEPAFLALATQAAGSVPLMRVFYHNVCGIHHDELVAGRPRFERARRQGAELPLFELHYSGIMGETTLVVEALDQGCPQPEEGILGPVSMPAITNEFGDPLPPWVTVDDLRAAAPSGEVFVNGQFDPSNTPRAIARSFVKISPGPTPDLDWFKGFGPDDTLGTLVPAEWCGEPEGGTCFQQYRMISEEGDFIFMFVEGERYGMEMSMGELWVNYADLGADVNGKWRFTPTPKAEVSSNSYLYVTMEVNSFTTSRRYPQIIITDQEAPTQWTMQNGYALVVQTFGEWPYEYQLELCDHQTWDVNDQCPVADMRRYFDGPDSTDVVGFAPNAEVSEQTGVDRSTRYEVYVSATRAYLLLDGKPYGCVNLPSERVPTGEVTVTFGDVLYHSGVDQVEEYTFIAENLHNDSSRHYDNLGFKSGVSEPEWNEEILPCTSEIRE